MRSISKREAPSGDCTGVQVLSLVNSFNLDYFDFLRLRTFRLGCTEKSRRAVHNLRLLSHHPTERSI